jgi:phosphatidate cytidylyltransferase
MTTALSVLIGGFVFQGTPLSAFHHLLMMGLMLSFLGQCGDLVISSIKRDLNIKDMAETIPGHGGLLDRFDSLLLVSPTLFHYINYFHGIGLDQPVRILTGE